MSKKIVFRGSVFSGVILTLGFLIFPLTALAAAHSAGTNVVANGTVYMITDDGQKRPYTSSGAFLSYGFNSWETLQQASTEDLALPTGSYIPPRDGKVVCSDRGDDKNTCYLISNGKRAGFVSEAVFRALGFDFSKTISGDVSFMEKDANISDVSERHRAGVLVNRNGTIYLVTSTGLLGILSPAVLNSWGYAFTDAVNANNSDASLTQTSVVVVRQGARLSPNGDYVTTQPVPLPNPVPPAQPQLTEDQIVKSYFDSHPDLPTVTTDSPGDMGLVLSLDTQVRNINSWSASAYYPYLSKLDIELLNKAPNFKAYLEDPGSFLMVPEIYTYSIKIFQGETTALYTRNQIQDDSEYRFSDYFVAVKENGVWKWDLIGTIKYIEKMNKLDNPSDAYVVGSSGSDVRIVDAVYRSIVNNYYSSQNPLKVNTSNQFVAVNFKNNGITTIKKLKVVVRLNGVVVHDDYSNVTLYPDKSVYIGFYIDRYWKISGVPKNAGPYAAEITASLGSSVMDQVPSDNTKLVTAIFSN